MSPDGSKLIAGFKVSVNTSYVIENPDVVEQKPVTEKVV